MVRNYKRKTDRGSWSEECMQQAINAVLQEKMGYYKAAQTFSVPQTTLERKVQAARTLNENPEENKPIKVPLGPKSSVFSKAEEDELCNYLLEMEERLYGLTTKDLKALVFQLAVKNNKPHPFNSEKEEAGRDWIYGFLKRHSELSIRKPENTSAARASGFNKVAVDKFFNFLGNVYDEHHLSPERIYNCDETGVSVVPKTKSKIVAKRGRKQVGAIVSAERGQTVTVEICFNAAGNYMPPMLVFPRKRMNPELMANTQAGCWGTCSESGWMTSELFLQWFKRFVIFSGASVDRPVLLLLDGHSTHTQNIEVINEARAHGVIILCFPPHTTHRLQVADVSFMRPLSIYYDQAVTAWLRSNPGLVVTIRQVAEIFAKAYIQAATMSTAINGFQKCGIWPYNPNVFSETDFAPSLTTEIPTNDGQAVANHLMAGCSHWDNENDARTTDPQTSPSLLNENSTTLQRETCQPAQRQIDEQAEIGPPAQRHVDQQPETGPPAQRQVDQQPETSPPAQLQVEQQPKTGPPAQLQVEQQAETGPPAQRQVDQQPETSPPAQLQVEQQPKTGPPAQLQVEQQAETGPPAQRHVDQQPETGPLAQSQVDQQPETGPPAQLQVEQQAETGPPAQRHVDQQPETGPPAQRQVDQQPETGPPAQRQVGQQSETGPPAQRQVGQQPETGPPVQRQVGQQSETGPPQPNDGQLMSPQATLVRRFDTSSGFKLVSPKQLLPPPVTKKTARVTRKRGKTAILTSSPYKQELEAAVQKKKDAEDKKAMKKKRNEEKKRSKLQKGRKVQTKRRRVARKQKSDSSSSESEGEDTPCLYCKDLYSSSIEGWISCSSCGKWAHNSCAGVDEEDDEPFHVCAICQPD